MAPTSRSKQPTLRHGDHLTHLPDLIAHARRTRTIMVQNLALSGLLIAVLIPVATFGVLGLGAVVAVHELAEIVVIGNGLRACRSIYGHDHAHAAQALPPKPDIAVSDHSHASSDA